MVEENWLNPLNKLKLQAAFRKKAPQVTLRSGQKLSLDYTEKDKVKLHPIPTVAYPDPYVPMGVMDLRTVLDNAWLD